MRTHDDTQDDLTVVGMADASQDGGIPSESHDGGTTLTHPEQVLADETLTRSRKRAILASWASDRRAVENAPALRRLGSGAVISIDEILEAMTALDRLDLYDGPGETSRTVMSLRSGRSAGKPIRRIVAWTDRDDDPPPLAAAAARPFRPIFTAAVARSA